jgi:TonB-dependent starch-binding outer membrane protein SusC
MEKKYQTFRIVLATFVFLVLTVSASAQTVQVSGKVTSSDGGEALPGVNVVVKGTTKGTATDVNGVFNLETNSNDVLVLSVIGYATQEISVSGRTVIDVALEEDVNRLDEIVVVGYGTQEKRSLVGSVAKISSERIEGRPVASAEQALQGLTPGLNVAQPGASPGDLATINVRGIGSISAGYSPLFVIDGFPTDQRNFASINPRDIESIEVLKDASSTAIYGSRGANGVILVTTKAAKEGKMQMNVGTSVGVATIPDNARIDLLSGAEYVQYYTESFTNRGLPVPSYLTDWDGTDTNWQDVVYQKGTFQDYNLSAAGGNEKTSFLISGNYIDQEGVVIGEGQQKYSARVKVDYRPSSRISFGMYVAPNVTNIRRSSPAPEDGLDWASLNSLAYLLPPIVPVYRDDGTYAIPNDLSIIGPAGSLANPLELAEQYKRKTQLFRMLTSAYASFEIVKGLTFKSSLGLNFGTDRAQTYYTPNGPRMQLPNTTTLNLGKSQESGWLSETTLNYKRVVNDHSFDALIGYTAQENNYESLNSNVNSIAINGPILLSLGDTKTLTSTNGVTSNTLLSSLGRLNYSFKGKYLLTATVRRDGSSRFGANNRYKTFGSIAAGWLLSEESFMDNLSFVTTAKIRGSYGTTGSNGIPDFVARPSLNPVNQAFGSSLIKGVYNGDPGNENLTWETSEKLDIGLDLSLVDNRVNVVFDYYDNKTSDLLLSKSLPTSSGYAGTLTNIGEMRNWGYELMLDANVIRKNDFSLTLGGNVTHNNQEVLSLGGAQELFNFFGALRTVVGGELQQIRGVKAIGVVKPGEVIPAQPNVVAGDIKFEDFDNNGAIGDFLSDDGQLVGDPNLDWIYGFNATLRFKNFELFALLQGQAGGYVYDFYLIQVGTDAQGVNLSKEFWYDGRYVSESQQGNGTTPRAGALLTGNAGVGFVSSLGAQKTDYLRIRNITLSYNIPASLSEKISVRGARIFTSVENLVTFTDFIGGNPDARRNSIGGPGLIGGSRLGGTYDGRELGLTSVPSLPLPRTWTFGLNFSF